MIAAERTALAKPCNLLSRLVKWLPFMVANYGILFTKIFHLHVRLVILTQLANMLAGHGDQSKLDPQRQPICLLLGGGMAAGKSTVRKIIGEAEFWTRVSFYLQRYGPLVFHPTAVSKSAAKCTLQQACGNVVHRHAKRLFAASGCPLELLCTAMFVCWTL